MGAKAAGRARSKKKTASRLGSLDPELRQGRAAQLRPGAEFTFMGLDPGKGGGIAAIGAGGALLFAEKMPDTPEGVLDVLARVDPSRTVAILERVSSSPQQGVASAFTFGRGYGMLIMALTGATIPFSLETPQVWQKSMNCRTGGDKNITKLAATRLFPKTKVTHAIADAILIAAHCRKKHILVDP